jgi:hypothetical protein
MSDLTTLAALERAIERAKDRIAAREPWAVSAVLALQALAEEIRAERTGPERQGP